MTSKHYNIISMKNKDVITKEADGVKCHYMRLYLYVDEIGLEDIIENQRIRISCPMRTNDPTEGVAQNELSQNAKVREYGYICLSSIHNSPSMWGYYGNRSRGACIVFDFQVLIRNENQFQILRNGIDNKEPWVSWLQKIKYCNNRALAEICNEGKSEPNFDLLTTKSKDWKHEREYRIFYPLCYIDANNIELKSESDGKRAIYYDKRIVQNIAGIILGFNYCGSPSDIQAKIKISKRKYDEQGLSLTRPFPLNNVKIIEASLDKKRFNYKIDINNVPTKIEDTVNGELQKLFSAPWKPYQTNSNTPMNLTGKPVKQGYCTQTRIMNQERNFAILVADINNSFYFALFEYDVSNPEAFYMVHTINQENLKALFIQARNYVINKNTTSPSGAERYIMPHNCII